jgi:3-oxoacyl-[acyl-carrier protein] reductase
MRPKEWKNNYGRILLIASFTGKEENPGMVGYSATNSGVIGLVKGIGKEYAETGITINGLAFVVIKTTVNGNTAPEQLAYRTAKIPTPADSRRSGSHQRVDCVRRT